MTQLLIGVAVAAVLCVAIAFGVALLIDFTSFDDYE